MAGMKRDEMESRLTEVEDVVGYLQVTMADSDDVKRNQVLISEALLLIKGILVDLIDTVERAPKEEYEEDLDRIDQLAHLIR